jgi:hypothetical protein
MSSVQQDSDIGSASDPKGFFEALYRHFILRDLFGKVIPGFITLTALAAMLFNPQELKSSLHDLSVMGWLAAIGVGWLTGFIIQSLGESCGLIFYYPMNKWLYRPFRSATPRTWPEVLEELRKLGTPKTAEKLREMNRILSSAEFNSSQEFYEFSVPIVNQWNVIHSANVERLTVIKEACGNGYVSLLIAFSAFTIKYAADHGRPAQLILGALLLGVGALFLARMHFEHVRRQHYYSVEGVHRNDWHENE